MPTAFAIESPARAFSGSTTAYVIGSDNALVIDPAGQTPELTEELEQRNVAHLAVTHHHRDHVGAVQHYASKFDLTVWARIGRADDFKSATGIEPDRYFHHGTIISADDEVTVIETPGHAPEHVAFSVPGETDSRPIVVSGDLATAAGSVVVGAPEGDMRAYFSSLRRIHARNPATMLPAHGPTIENPRETCSRLLSHRRNREERIRKAVLEGHETPDAIVDATYEKDISDVYSLALATTVAHLEKLDVEEAIEWNGATATPPT